MAAMAGGGQSENQEATVSAMFLTWVAGVQALEAPCAAFCGHMLGVELMVEKPGLKPLPHKWCQCYR